MLISYSINLLIYQFLQIREILIYAILSKGTNELAKTFDSYRALIGQLAKNHKCTLEDLTINAINDGNHELLDLLERSGAEPCKYFDKQMYKSLSKKCELKTILWFDKQLNLNLNIDRLINKTILTACEHEIYLPIVQDYHLFISNNPNKIESYLLTAIKAVNLKTADWFYEKYPDESHQFLPTILKYIMDKTAWYHSNRQIINWIVEHQYLDLVDSELKHDAKLAIIDNSATTDIYGSRPIDFLKADPLLVRRFVANSFLIRKHEQFLLQYRNFIEQDIENVIGLVIYWNDVDAFNWLCSHCNVAIHRSNIIAAFKYGRIEIIKYLLEHKYQLGNPYVYLDAITSLDDHQGFLAFNLFDQMEKRIVQKEHMMRLIGEAIRKNRWIFLLRLFIYYQIKPGYFTVEDLSAISFGLSYYKHIDIVSFFVSGGYDICVDCDLSSITKNDRRFLKYILENSNIKKIFKYPLLHPTVEKIIALDDLKILQWYMETYGNQFDAGIIEFELPGIIKNCADKPILYFLDYLWASGVNSQDMTKIGSKIGSKIISESPTIGQLALFHGRVKILDWLREKNIKIRHPHILVRQIICNKMFNMVYYLRKYFHVNIQIKADDWDQMVKKQDTFDLTPEHLTGRDCFDYYAENGDQSDDNKN